MFLGDEFATHRTSFTPRKIVKRRIVFVSRDLFGLCPEILLHMLGKQKPIAEIGVSCRGCRGASFVGAGWGLQEYEAPRTSLTVAGRRPKKLGFLGRASLEEHTAFRLARETSDLGQHIVNEGHPTGKRDDSAVGYDAKERSPFHEIGNLLQIQVLQDRCVFLGP